MIDALETPPAVGEILIADGELGEDKFTGGVRLTVTGLSRVSEARARFSKYLLLNLTPDDVTQFEPLRTLLGQYPGSCAIQIKYKNGSAEQILPLAPQFGVLPEDNLLDALMQLLSAESVRVCY